MKKQILILAATLTMGSFAHAFINNAHWDCSSEISDEDNIEISINFAKRKASLQLNGAALEVCQNAKTFGGEKVLKQDEGDFRMECAGGNSVVLTRNHDETMLDISALNLGLKEDSFICSQIED